ncbi:MAG: hypothetical protein ABSC95_00335 [Acetobacteraceae bacterium]|jgi:hypothetical protein
MRILSVARLWLFAAPLVVAAVPASAQLRPPSDSNLSYGGMLGKKAPPAAQPDVPAPPSAWPRLDPGAVLCRSEDDLARRAAIMRGEQAGPADCRPISQPTAIQIVHRAGPGRTEVKVTGRTETGWTDAWLPPTPPPGTTPVNAGQPAGGNPTSSR